MESESTQPQLIGTINKRPEKMVLSRNQKLLAIACRNSLGSIKNLHVYDTTTCDEKFKLDVPEKIIDMRFSDDNATLHLITRRLKDHGCRYCDRCFRSVYKYSLINNESGTILRSCKLGIQDTVTQHYPKIWSDYLWGLTRRKTLTEKEPIPDKPPLPFTIFLFKAHLAFSFYSSLERLCSVESAHKEYAVSPDGDYLAYCTSPSEISIMYIPFKQTIRSIETCNPHKIFISNDQQLLIVKAFTDAQEATFHKIYKFTSDTLQELLSIPVAGSNSTLKYQLSSNNTFITVHERKRISDPEYRANFTHILQIIDLSNPDTSLELFNNYKVSEDFSKQPYPVAIGNTALAFLIPSTQSTEDSHQETVIGIFNITNVIKST
jgi:hypothetical protein